MGIREGTRSAMGAGVGLYLGCGDEGEPGWQQDMAMTRQEALRLVESRFWESMTSAEIAQFQLNEDRLCMPFGVFQAAVERALGRSVVTYEFGFNRDGLKAELLRATGAAGNGGGSKECR